MINLMLMKIKINKTVHLDNFQVGPIVTKMMCKNPGPGGVDPEPTLKKKLTVGEKNGSDPRKEPGSDRIRICITVPWHVASP